MSQTDYHTGEQGPETIIPPSDRHVLRVGVGVAPSLHDFIDILQELNAFLPSAPEPVYEIGFKLFSLVESADDLLVFKDDGLPATGTAHLNVGFRSDVLDLFRDFLTAARTGQIDDFVLKHGKGPFVLSN